MNIVLISLLVMGGLGLFFAIVMAIASEKLKVKIDPRVTQVEAALPGLNCGACGYSGCHALAENIVAKWSLENLRCPPGGPGTEEEIAKILGVSTVFVIKMRAVVKCGGGKSLAGERADYHGIKTCAAAELVSAGPKACTFGCPGYGDCVKVCPFDAMYMGEDGLPHLIEEKCTACGLCVEACPRKIIELVPCGSRIMVACNSKDKCGVVREVCKVGCIGCKICEKLAPGAYEVKDILARVIYEKGDAAALPAIEKCPTKCIVKL